jgi:uncharacterized SAM-dependent methyltransferase
VKYFRNTELAKIYNVSEKSVRNWIQAAREDKLELQLEEKNGKYWIANTTKNTALIEQQVQKGKKFKNRRALKILTPTQGFYKSYNPQQILDIINGLTINHEIPTQYSYIDGGAQYWNSYANRLAKEDTPNILSRTIELLDASSGAVDNFVNNAAKVNIVDLGPGNGLPIRSTIARFHNEGRLNKYIAIDSSKEMLDIVESNIKKWFSGEVKFEGHIIDFSYQRFNQIFANDYMTKNEGLPLNLVFLLGGTLSNFRSPQQTLQTINQSMGLNDLLIYSAYLDTPNNRRYFDFNIDQPNQKLRSELILDKMGIHDSLYSIEQIYDERQHARFGGFVPKVDLTIEFTLGDSTQQVELQKNHRILFWRHWHKNALEMMSQFNDSDFDLLQMTKSNDQQYLILISKIKISGQ